MVEALGLEGDERVLEIGTGYGWQTALLARLVREVFSVERFADLAETARAALADRENVVIVAARRRRAARAAARPGGAEDVVLFEKRGGALHRLRSIGGAHFVRLHGRHGFG